jgi:glycosyltransferase involved in cell wall biosynthesis
MVISSFLEDYYRRKGCRTLRVPPLVDLGDERWVQDPEAGPPPEGLHLAYAGTPGRKDLLLNVLRGLAGIGTANTPVLLNLFGPTRESLTRTLPECDDYLQRLGPRVIFHGRVPQEEVPRRIMSSHFSVLLRPDELYSRAGFPTKVAESLSAGVPVICNPCGDIADVIRDGRDGILLNDHTGEAFAAGVSRALAIGPAGWLQMRTHARERARVLFDYRSWVNPIHGFITQLQASEIER